MNLDDPVKVVSGGKPDKKPWSGKDTFTKSDDRVRAAKWLSPMSKNLHTELAQRQNWKRDCHFTYEALSDYFGVSVSTIQRAMSPLLDVKLVKRYKREFEGKKFNVRYRTMTWGQSLLESVRTPDMDEYMWMKEHEGYRLWNPKNPTPVNQIVGDANIIYAEFGEVEEERAEYGK